ncbi:glutathione S-transferase [Salinisphaera dokdonensis CL-ES53]|uniref:Glutathione S-transferase n=2 Tax=Salinisphaera TaxID=180541 RepID=A0ABV2B5T2_9GAMM
MVITCRDKSPGETMTISLYAHRLSQPSRAAEILLRELGIAYDWQEVDFANGETREPHFAEQINPFQTIPALVVSGDDPDFVLGESHAIMRYLCRIAADAGGDAENAQHWYPGDRDARRSARIDQWMAWHHNGIRRYDMFHDIMNLHLTLPMLKYELQSTALKPLQDGLRSGLATLEAHFERQPQDTPAAPTLCGDAHPTLADLTITCELYQIVAVGYRFDRYPQVAQWLNGMAERDHFKRVSEEVLEQGRTIREASGDYLELDAFA